MERRMKEFLQASYWSSEQVRYKQGERMALPGRDRGSVGGTHGILTAVNWCFREGVGQTAEFYWRTEKT
jgi:hypothetical protein